MKKYLLPLILILLTVYLTGHCATYTSQYPPEHNDTYVKATSSYANTAPYFATNPALGLTGGFANVSWYATGNVVTEQRFHIDLGSVKIIRRIYYENSHDFGYFTNRGAKNFTFWGSNTGAGTFDDLVYGNDGGWTEIDVSQNTLDIHSGSPAGTSGEDDDNPDPKYITVNNVIEYRYYAFKFADGHTSSDLIGIRHVELQTEDGWSPGITWNGITITKWNGITITTPINTQ